MALNSEQRAQALKYLRNLKEDSFRKEVLIPLYRVLGFKHVVESHGQDEFGKDILFKYIDKFGEYVYLASLVKTQDIHGSTSKLGNVSEVLAQAREAFEIPYLDRFDNHSKKHISMLYIVTSGVIKPKARQYISESLNKGVNYGVIRFQDGEQILSLLEQNVPTMVEGWLKGKHVTSFIKTNLSSDFYPTLTVYFKHPISGEPIPVLADFDSGVSPSLVSKEFLESICFKFSESDVSNQYVGSHLGLTYVYEKQKLEVSLDGKKFKKVPLILISDWKASPLVKVNSERVMLLGRDIPIIFGSLLELDFSNI